jgi:hypothetical protein
MLTVACDPTDHYSLIVDGPDSPADQAASVTASLWPRIRTVSLGCSRQSSFYDNDWLPSAHYAREIWIFGASDR